VQLGYNYRLYPAPGQRAALARAFGCARVVFNDALRARHEAHQAGQPYPTGADLSARLTAAKATPERSWLSDVSAVVLQQALADLNAAYRNYFASLTGERKGRRAGPPTFRSRKDTRQAVRFTRNARFSITPGGKLRLPKIGDIPVRWSRLLPSQPSSVTVITDPAGRYLASFVIQAEPGALPETAATLSHRDGPGQLITAEVYVASREPGRVRFTDPVGSGRLSAVPGRFGVLGLFCGGSGVPCEVAVGEGAACG
jgi:putative transposase